MFSFSWGWSEVGEVTTEGISCCSVQHSASKNPKNFSANRFQPFILGQSQDTAVEVLIYFHGTGPCSMFFNTKHLEINFSRTKRPSILGLIHFYKRHGLMPKILYVISDERFLESFNECWQYSDELFIFIFPRSFLGIHD